MTCHDSLPNYPSRSGLLSDFILYCEEFSCKIQILSCRHLSCLSTGPHCTPTPFLPSWWDVKKKWREAYRTALMTHFDQLLLIIYWRWIGNSLCWNSSLKVIHLTWGQCFDHHGMLYIISNLPKVAIWRSKDFRIRPLMAEKSTTLLFRGTFGHTVTDITVVIPDCRWPNDKKFQA